MAEVVLHGWHHSLYTQAARVVLAEKGVDYGFSRPCPDA
jgi:hypothetical protein